jgi:DNA-nicking Smr family endonuclease
MRRITGEDAALWQRAMRGVAPLPGCVPSPDGGRPAHNAPEPQLAPGRRYPAGTKIAGETPVLPRKPPPPLDHFAGIDRATAERLRRGQRDIETRLDLHGMTQAEAHRALQGFVAGSRAAGRRCVLVITGHGRMSGGILKSAVPRWLHEPDLRRHVLAIAPARPQHGGSGALYVLLKKER